MGVVTLEGTVEQGQIRLPGDVRLPDHTRVYVVVPHFHIEGAARVVTPRLAHPEQAEDFTMQVLEECPDAGV